MGTMIHPKWWTRGHTSAWERVREALRRDWEQTKHDFSKKAGHELDQDLDDTVFQAAGKEPIPPGNLPNTNQTRSFDDVEVPMGFGYGARMTFGQQLAGWDPDVEQKLEKDWNDYPGNGHQPWDKVKPWVRQGWEYKA